MNEKRPNIIWEAILDDFRQMVREEIRAALNKGSTASNETTTATPPYLTVTQAAERSSLAPSTIRLMIRKGRLQSHHVGRRVIIKRTDLEQFLESQPNKIVDF